MKKIKALIKLWKTKIKPSRDVKGQIGYYRFSHGITEANRISLVNHLICLRGYEKYLEIGVRDKSAMHDKVISRTKCSVDPDINADADFIGTSDEFFEQCTQKFDLIFIDGLHTGEQVKADIHNSLRFLNPGGAILLHDMNPPTAFHARENYEVEGEFPAWNGTSWQGYAWYRKYGEGLRMFVIDTDWGVGWIEQGDQVHWDGAIETYEDLENSRKQLLNLINVENFIKLSRSGSPS